MSLHQYRYHPCMATNLMNNIQIIEHGLEFSCCLSWTNEITKCFFFQFIHPFFRVWMISSLLVFALLLCVWCIGQKLVFIVLFWSQSTLNRNEKMMECRQTTAANRHVDCSLSGQRLNLKFTAQYAKYCLIFVPMKSRK